MLGRTLDELPPQTRKLLTALHGWVKVECEHQAINRADFRFTRRQVRELTGWGNTQLGIHLARLVEMEYLFEHGARRGQVSQYELAYSGEGGSGQGVSLNPPLYRNNGVAPFSLVATSVAAPTAQAGK